MGLIGRPRAFCCHCERRVDDGHVCAEKSEEPEPEGVLDLVLEGVETFVSTTQQSQFGDVLRHTVQELSQTGQGSTSMLIRASREVEKVAHNYVNIMAHVVTKEARK